MPNPSYAFFSNDIKGVCDVADMEDSIEILELYHAVEIPVDVKDASTTGTRRHGAMKLVANIDSATPLLMDCVCKSKVIDSVEIKFRRQTSAGEPEIYFTIAMETVRVTKVETWYPNVDDDRTTNYKDMVNYELRYDKIKWLYTDGNIEATDSWRNK